MIRIIQTKRWLLMLFLLLLLDFSESEGQVIENPSISLSRGRSSLGLELGAFSRGVDFSDREAKEGSVRSFITGNYGVTDQLTLYGALGVGKINDDAGFRGDLGAAYGGGIKFNLYEWNNINFGLIGQVLHFTSRDPDLAGIPDLASEFVWNEFNMAVGAGSQFAGGSFYGGLLLSKVNGELKISAPTDVRQESHFNESRMAGFFWGGDVNAFGPVRIGIEIRMVRDLSASLYMRYTFGSRRAPVGPPADPMLHNEKFGVDLEEVQPKSP